MLNVAAMYMGTKPSSAQCLVLYHMIVEWMNNVLLSF